MVGGLFATKRKALVDFYFPELNGKKNISWKCHVDDKTKKEDAMYDMVIGMDLMTKIGIYVNTEKNTYGGKVTLYLLNKEGSYNIETTSICCTVCTVEFRYSAITGDFKTDDPFTQDCDEGKGRYRNYLGSWEEDDLSGHRWPVKI